MCGIFGGDRGEKKEGKVNSLIVGWLKQGAGGKVSR